MTSNSIKSFLFLLVMLIQLACVSNQASAQSICISGGEQTFTLYAGQHIPVGTVSVAVSGGNLVVTYNTTGGWELTSMHLWVGDDMGTMPQTRTGNPKVGHFPYTHSSEGMTSYSHYIPLADITDIEFACSEGNGTGFYMAAQADVQLNDNGTIVQTEGAWSDGPAWLTRGNWMTYSVITLTCNCNEPTCETAFAYDDVDATCFMDLDMDGNGVHDFNRWGWVIGPLGSGNYMTEVYAAAGQCDTNKGTMVGTLHINIPNDSSSATISYVMGPDESYPVFTLDQAHINVGCGEENMLPTNENGAYTVAPGKYSYTEDLEDLTYHEKTIYVEKGSCISGIYIVAHANVCGYFGEE